MEEKIQKDVAEQTEVKDTEKTSAAEQVERKPHELLYERIRTSRPDGKYEGDDEEYSRQVMSMLDDLEKKSGEYDEMTKKIMNRFNQNPEETEAFLDYLDGMPLPTAIRRRMGDEALTMEEGDEGWDEYVKAGEERKKQFEDSKAAVEQYLNNAQASDADFTDFVKEKGMSEEDSKKFQDVITSIANDMSVGRISKETLALLKRAIDYDNDIAGAREQGKVDGKNSKIELEKKRMAGSGLPDANAGGNAAEEVEEKQLSETADWLKKFRK